MKKPLLALLTLASLSAHAVITDEKLAQEMIAEGALSMEEMQELEAEQAAQSFSFHALNSLVNNPQGMTADQIAEEAAPLIEDLQIEADMNKNTASLPVGRVANMNAPTQEQLNQLIMDKNKGEMCGRKMNLFALTDAQILGALQAEQLRLMKAGSANIVPVFIDVNKSPREYTRYNARTKKHEVIATNPTGQTMKIYTLENGALKKTLEVAVSTGKEETVKASSRSYCATTPAGFFRPYKIYRSYESATWAGSQMPNAVFLYRGIALHATPNDASHQGSLGKRMSGGCVRLQGPDYARAIGRPNDSEVDISLKVRLETMKTGKGIQTGNFGTVNEGNNRVRITNNSIKTHAVERDQGLTSATANTDGWGTLVYIHY
jgi:lipoprotein-anchoring transpeptidase ErfK/SrfK